MAHAPLSAVSPSAHAHPVMKEATALRTSTSAPLEAMIVLVIPFATTPTVATFAHVARDTRAMAKSAALDALILTNVLSAHTTVARNLSALTMTVVSNVPVAKATSAIRPPSVVNARLKNPSQAAKR